MNGQFDEIDDAIVLALQQDSSISNVRLAKTVGLSPAATLARVKKLEQEGVIEGYGAKINLEKIGYDLLCFVQVSLANHDVTLVTDFRKSIQDMPEVIECHFITGSSDYLLKVAVKNRSDLEFFLVHTLTPVPGVTHLQTSLVLSEIKGSTILPIHRPQN